MDYWIFMEIQVAWFGLYSSSQMYNIFDKKNSDCPHNLMNNKFLRLLIS